MPKSKTYSEIILILIIFKNHIKCVSLVDRNLCKYNYLQCNTLIFTKKISNFFIINFKIGCSNKKSKIKMILNKNDMELILWVLKECIVFKYWISATYLIYKITIPYNSEIIQKWQWNAIKKTTFNYVYILLFVCLNMLLLFRNTDSNVLNFDSDKTNA